MNQRVLVASNRGPVSYQFGADGSLIPSRGGGGMIAGVTDGLAALGPGASATWICAALSDADRAVARAGDTSDGNGIPVRMLDIAPDIFNRAYNRVANSTLWFLLHQLFDTPNQPRFGREFRRDWETYLAYNEAFADALTEEAVTGEGDLCVLIQDYHLCLAPRLLRDRLSRRAVGHRLPGLLRRRAWRGRHQDRAGRPGSRPGRPGDLPGPRHRGSRAPARGGRGRAAGARPGRGRPGARRRAPPGRGRPQADRPGGPDRTIQEHRARPGRVPRTARHPAAVARPRGAPGLRLPVPVGPGRVPHLHRPGPQSRRPDQRGIPHRRLGSAGPGGEGRLPAVAGRLRPGRRAAGEPDQGRDEPGRAGGSGALRARLRAGPVP